MKNDFQEIKELLLEKEKHLSPFASNSFNSRGREVNEPLCPFRNNFQRDRDRILHSKAFRRLKGKTQVFYAPSNDHFRTRLTHSLEVSQISTTIARILNLNEDLTEAIALGHDLGHAPFGHSGEEALNLVVKGGFCHNVNSVRIAQVIEGLNLTKETLDGILNHTGSGTPFTLEGQIVKIADRIAYLTHDMEDAIRAGILSRSDLPKDIACYFGDTKSGMLRIIITDIYKNSVNQPKITASDECVNFLNKLRAWMFKNVYFSDKTKSEEKFIKEVVVNLFNYYKEKTSEQNAIDYVAGMSDEFALCEHKKLIEK